MLNDENKDVKIIVKYFTDMRTGQRTTNELLGKTNELLAKLCRELQALREWIQKERK